MDVGVVDITKKEVAVKSMKRSVKLIEILAKGQTKPSEWNWRFYDVSAGHDCVGWRVNYEYQDEHGWWHFQIGVEDIGVDWDYNDIVVTGYPDMETGRYRIDISGSAAHRNRAYLNGGLVYDSASGRSTVYLDSLFNIKEVDHVVAVIDWGDGTQDKASWKVVPHATPVTDPDIYEALGLDPPARWFSYSIDYNSKTLYLTIEGATHKYSDYGTYYITAGFFVYFKNGSYASLLDTKQIELKPPVSSPGGEDSEPPGDANPPGEEPEPDPDEMPPVPPGDLPPGDQPDPGWEPLPPAPPYDPLPPYDEIPDTGLTYPFKYWEDPLFPWSFSDPASPYYSPKLDPNSSEYDPQLDPNNVKFYEEYAEANNPFGALPHRLSIEKVGVDKDEYAWRKDAQGTITFVVLDENDAPVADAEIKLVEEDGEAINYTVEPLSKAGWFKITWDIPHVDKRLNLRVYAGKKDYAPAVARVSPDVSEWGAYYLDVQIVTDADKYQYGSTTPANVTVYIYDGNGTAITGATVVDNFGNSYTDNGDGTYSGSVDISGLPVGTWKLGIKATKDGYKPNYISRVKTESFVADGETTTFKLSTPFAEILKVTINGTETTNYTTANNQYGELEITINDTLNGGDDIVVEYYPYFPTAGLVIVESVETITVIVRDEESISKYGERPMVTLYIPSLQSEDEARQIGQAYLEQYAHPKPQYEIEMPYIHLHIGDEVITNLPNGNFVRKKISYIEHKISSNSRNTIVGLNYTKELLAKTIESLTRRV